MVGETLHLFISGLGIVMVLAQLFVHAVTGTVHSENARAAATAGTTL